MPVTNQSRAIEDSPDSIADGKVGKNRLPFRSLAKITKHPARSEAKTTHIKNDQSRNYEYCNEGKVTVLSKMNVTWSERCKINKDCG